MKNRKFAILLIVMAFLFNACISEKKQATKWCSAKNDVCSFECYSDHMFFYSHSKYTMGADNWTYYPIPFKISVPLTPLRFGYLNNEQFLFYYPNKQYIFIFVPPLVKHKTDTINIFPKYQFNDTIYTPTDEKRDSIIGIITMLVDQSFKVTEDDFDKIKNRRDLVIEKKSALIFLINIKKNKINDFTKSLSDFEITR